MSRKEETMTETDKLRALLDGRGVGYVKDDNGRIAWTYWGDWSFMEPLDAKPGTLGARCELMLVPAIAEQAVDATLGRGECEDATPQAEFCFTCSECGHVRRFVQGWNRETDEGQDGFRFCPSCGRRVRGEL